jgi:hypothetical protein
MKTEESKNINENKILYYRNVTSFLLLTLFLGLALIPELAINYFFKDELKVQPSKLTRLLTISRFPWVINPIFGMITDFYPIFGYKKKIYILFCGLIFCSVWLILGLLKINSLLTVICFFISNVTCCFSTVLSQAIMIEIGGKMDEKEEEENREKKKQTNKLITYNAIISNFGILIGSYLKGELIQLFNIRIVFIITSCLGLLPLISAIILKEFNDENDENSSILNTSVKSNENEQTLIDYMFQKKIIIPFIIFLFVTTIPITFDTYFYYEIHYLNFKPVDFSKINVIYQVVTLIVIYLYDKLDCNTTKCSFFFIKFISTGSGFFFYLIYNEYYEKFNLNPFYIILFVTTIQFCLNQIFNIMIYKISAKLTIKKFEETVFSTLTTTINVGYILGLLYSSILTDVTGITRKDFSNFGKFIIVTNIVSVFPTIFILFTPSSYFEPKIIKDEIKNEENNKEIENKIEIKENDDEEELLL